MRWAGESHTGPWDRCREDRGLKPGPTGQAARLRDTRPLQLCKAKAHADTEPAVTGRSG